MRRARPPRRRTGVDLTNAPSQGRTKPFAGVFAPLASPIFAAIWWASLVSNFGGMIQSVGASWMMTAISATPDMVAYVQTAATLPIMAFALIAGALADTIDRRLLMIGALSLMMAASAGLALLATFGGLGPWTLLAFTFLIGSGGALYAPAWQASVVDQTPREDFAAAVALNSLGFNLARAVGPAIGGLIVAAGGATAAFAINAASYIGLIVVLARWRRPAQISSLPPEPLWPAISAGLRYVALSPPLVAVMVRSSLFGLCAAALWALLPVVAREGLGGGPLTYGILLGAFGAGAMGGALASARLRERYDSNAIVNGASLAYALAALGIAFAGSAFVVAPAMAIAGAAWVLALSTFNIGVQTSSPRWVAGRAIAVYQMAAFAGLALGAALWGLAAREFGLATTLTASGIALAATLAFAALFPAPGASAQDLAPWTPPQPIEEPQIALEHRSGPIVTEIAYRIEPAHASAFADVMRALGRIRTRDGARRWRLMQDLDDPAVWVERFESPTWIDHLRRRTRFTVADSAIRDRLIGYYAAPPLVRRFLERPQGSTPMGAPHPETPLPDATLQH